MAERPAINASPLIYLAKAGLLDLLRIADEKLVVPAPVAAEINVRGPRDVAVLAIEQLDWLDVVPSPPVSAVIQAWDLGDGESSVLAWGQAYPGTELIIDDLAARRCAATLGVSVRGTLGLVLAAKNRRIIHAARPIIDTLRASGMYLSDRVVNEVLRLVGE